MAQNWRNYANYYVIPYIGGRDVLEIDGAVCDALYAKLLAEGRIKAKPKTAPVRQAIHVRRLGKDGKVQPCRPYRYDAYRCYRTHAEDDPLLGQPIESGKPIRQTASTAGRKALPPGLEPKTVVNTHRMLHRAWEDFTTWGWAKRNVVSDAHPPRVPRKGRKVWTVSQLQAFLRRSRHDRFFALWVLEATSGMRRCELAGARRDLLDLDAGTLEIEPTRVVVDGQVIESDGKTQNAQHTLALDPFTLAVLAAHVEMIDQRTRDFGPDYDDLGVLFCWENGMPPHPDTITRRFKKLSRAAGLPAIDLHDVPPQLPRPAGARREIDWKALSKRIGHATCVHHEAVRADRPRGRPRGREYARRLDHRRDCWSSWPTEARGRTTTDQGGEAAAAEQRPCTNPCTNRKQKAGSLFENRPLALVAGAGFEPATSGL